MSSIDLAKSIPRGFYPERNNWDGKHWERKLERIVSAHKTVQYSAQLRTVLKWAESYGEELRAKSQKSLENELISLKNDLVGVTWELSTIGRGFALIREIADRLIGLRHFETQLAGGWFLLNGMIAEMETGEGKTLTATLPACIMAMAGFPVHIVTVNDYLARRDGDWMAPVYHACGLTVGIITHEMSPAERQQAYSCDVTYCTNKEIVFDYLKDRLVFGRKPGIIQAATRHIYDENGTKCLLLRGLAFAIVDEADSVLIDEARTPLIISGQGDSTYESQVYRQAIELAGQLKLDQDFVLDAHKEGINLTPTGKVRLAQLVDGLETIWTGVRRREELVTRALTALHIYIRDRDYLVRDGRIQIVDEFTGRVLADRSWERGLHQMVEVKEDCRLSMEKDTLARISYQTFFRRYYHLSGMTGTANEVGNELWAVYGLRVVRVPTNKPVQRKILPCRLYSTRNQKWDALLHRVNEIHLQGRPILIGARSVEVSEFLSRKLNEVGLTHRVLNAHQDKEEANIISKAGLKSQITIATNMAGRGTDIRLGPGVDAQGGLHVIATEPHAARRIDRQLFGRCGRQGDPGSCEMFACLEDEILTSVFRNNWLCEFTAKTLVSVLNWKWSWRYLVSLAQRNTEKRHYQIRAELLAMDEIMNQTLAFSGSRE